MAIIQSGADATQLTVDPTSKGARVTLYDAAGNVVVGQKTMAASVPVAIASDQSAIPVTGALTVSGTVPVTGTVAISGTTPVSATSLPLPTGAATQATLAAVSAQLPATVGQKAMAASLAVAIASDQGAVPVSATALPLPAGAATQATLAAISAQLPATLGQKAMAASQAVVIASDQAAVPISDNGSSITVDGSVSLGTATGKTMVGKPGTLTTAAVTADQVVVTYTVTAGKTLYLQGWSWSVRLGTMAATATNFGTISLENPTGTKLFTDNLAAGAGAVPSLIYPPGEPLAIAGGTVIRIVVTPASTTSMVWTGNLIGYEK